MLPKSELSMDNAVNFHKIKFCDYPVYNLWTLGLFLVFGYYVQSCYAYSVFWQIFLYFSSGHILEIEYLGLRICISSRVLDTAT